MAGRGSGAAALPAGGSGLPAGRAALLEASQLDHRRASGWHGLAYALLEETLMRGFAGHKPKRRRRGVARPRPASAAAGAGGKPVRGPGCCALRACRGRNSMRRSSAPREFRRAPGGSFSCCGARSSCCRARRCRCGDRAPARMGDPFYFIHPVPALLRRRRWNTGGTAGAG